jgi:anthranilate synthase component 2
MILVIDHYDSFVYNLVQLVESLGYETLVVRSDEKPADELIALEPEGVILSPGPGTPEAAGCMIEVIGKLPDETPLLGVCLGHQAIGVGFGGRVDRGPVPVHGKASPIFHDGKGIFVGMPSPFEGGRYHSLVVIADEVPSELEVTAHTEDGLVMAVQHTSLPRYGVQFHPESILTPEGPKLVKNFLDLTSA